MNALRLLTTGMIICGATLVARTAEKAEKPDYAKLIVGKWEATKDVQDIPVGAVLEFTKDGKLMVTIKEDVIEASWKVEGDKLLIILKSGEKKDPALIKKISDTELIVEPNPGMVFEFKRTK